MSQCGLCNAELPRGVRVAFFSDQDSDEPFLGDFCSVSHAFAALEQVSSSSIEMPETLFLGVRVERAGHDETALARIMGEIARRAVQTALQDALSEGEEIVEETRHIPTEKPS